MFFRKTYTYFYSISLAQKIFWVCFFISTLCLTIVPGIIILQYNAVLQSQIEKKNLSTLNQLSKLIDTTLVEENFRHIQYFNSSWENTGTLSTETPAVFTYRIFKNWENYAMIHPNLHSYCLYSISSDTFLSSLEGINYHFQDRNSFAYAKYLAAYFNKNDLRKEQSHWLPIYSLTNPETPNQTTKLLTFVQPCSLLFPLHLEGHYLLINYDLDHIEQQIIPMLGAGGYFEFLDSQDQLLYSGKPADFDSSNYFMYAERSSVSGWTYRYFVPSTFWGNPMFFTLLFGVSIILTGLFLAFVLSRFLSQKIYRPLKNLLSTIHRHTDKTELTKNDIDFIQNAFHDLYSSKEILDNNLSLLEYQIGQLIFKGKISSPVEISQKLKLTTFSLHADSYCLLLIAFSPKVLSSKPLLPYESIAFMKEVFLSGDSALCVPYPENCVSILLTDQTDHAAINLHQLQHELSSVFKCPCSILESKTLTAFSEIASTFTCLKGGLSYLSLYGYDTILHQEQIELHENNRLNLSALFMPCIEKLLENNPDKLAEKSAEIFAYAKNKTIHFEDWSNFCHNLSFIFEKHSQHTNLQSGFVSLKKIHSPIGSPENYSSWCQAYIDLLSSRSLENKKKIADSPEFIEEIKKYICENIHADLSLENVAEKFYLTPNYLSKIFHEHNQTTFVGYLKEAKLKKAAELLKDNDLLIQNIAEAVGYSTPNYFNRIFKEHYGITPLQYRKKYL